MRPPPSTPRLLTNVGNRLFHPVGPKGRDFRLVIIPPTTGPGRLRHQTSHNPASSLPFRIISSLAALALCRCPDGRRVGTWWRHNLRPSSSRHVCRLRRCLPHPVLHHALLHRCSALPHGAEPGPVWSRRAHHGVEVLPSAQR